MGPNPYPAGGGIASVTGGGGVTATGTSAVTLGSAVGGDASGTVADLTVTRLRNTAVSATPPTAGQALVAVGGVWTPSTITTGVTAIAGANGITLTGSTGSVTAKLAASQIGVEILAAGATGTFANVGVSALLGATGVGDAWTLADPVSPYAAGSVQLHYFRLDGLDDTHTVVITPTTPYDGHPTITISSPCTLLYGWVSGAGWVLIDVMMNGGEGDCKWVATGMGGALTISAPVVGKINGSPLGATTGATTGDVLAWSGSAWAKSTPTAVRSGTLTLSSGTKAVTDSATTANTVVLVTLKSPSGVTLTTQYQHVSNSAGTSFTVQANVAAGTINTADGSTLNYYAIG